MIRKIFALIPLFAFLPTQMASAQDFVSPLPPQFSDGQQRAFPTAEGYGAIAAGGRGGSVCHVTNLNDTGTGSLRDCLENRSGALTVVFDVGGVIDLTGNIHLRNDNVTIAGQTAPGDGVCLRGGNISVSASDVIMRHMCTRRGDQRTGAPESVGDGLAFNNATRAIADHFSVSWTLDEGMQMWFDGNRDITVQNSLFYEPIDGFLEGEERNEGYGPLLADGGQRLSFHKNVMAHNRRRSPRLSNVADVDLINNIIFNWLGVATQVTDDSDNSLDTTRINVIGNVYRPGRDSLGDELEIWQLDGNANIYFGGNEDHEGNLINYVNNAGGTSDPSAFRSAANSRPEHAKINVLAASEIWSTLLDEAGARVPVLDEADALLIQQINEGTGGLIDCVDKEDLSDSLLVGPCDRESALGRWPIYQNTAHPSDHDSDRDGMPDAWEVANGLDPNNPDDRNGDMIGDGWTNLEYFLNQLAGDYSVTFETSDETTNDISGNEAPLVSVIAPLDRASVSGSEVPIQIEATDPDNQPQSLAITWQLDNGTLQEAVFNQASGYYEATWDSTATSDGDHLITAFATDGSDTTSHTTYVSAQNTTETSTGDEPVSAHIADLEPVSDDRSR